LVVVPPLELSEGLEQLDGGGEVADPQQVLFEGPDEAFCDAVPSGSRTKLGELAMPRKASSAWKSSLR
jgi:hypothetical protein